MPTKTDPATFHTSHIAKVPLDLTSGTSFYMCYFMCYFFWAKSQSRMASMP